MIQTIDRKISAMKGFRKTPSSQVSIVFSLSQLYANPAALLRLCSTMPKQEPSMNEEIAAAAVKAAPPVTIVGAQKLFDLTLNEWVAVATLVYLVLQAYVLIRNEFIRKRRK